MNSKYALMALLVTTLWGVNFVALKYGAMALSPFSVTCIRFALVSLLLAPWIFRFPRHLFWKLLGLSSVMAIAYFGSLFKGLQGVPSGEACVIVQIEVPLAAVLSAYWLKEKVSSLTWVAIFVCIVGVIVTVGLPQRMGDLVSIGFLLIAAVAWAVNSVQMKQVAGLHPFTINAAVCFMAAPQLLVLIFLFDAHPVQSVVHAPWTAWAAILYMALISTILCYSIWFYLLRKFPVSKVTPFYLISPVAALLTSNLITGEKLSIHTLLGTVILLIGLGLVVVRRDEK